MIPAMPVIVFDYGRIGNLALMQAMKWLFSPANPGHVIQSAVQTQSPY
jgi:hypothetical protein